jgi:uncharacterized protein
MRRQQAFRILVAIATAGMTLSLLAPADAQFWGGWGQPQPQRQPRYQQPQQQTNPFGNWFDPNPQQQQREQRPVQREAPPDYSRAPSAQKRPDATATTPILVLGDGMADWLAYGLEDAFSEKPEISIVRKNRAAAGLIRYDTRRETEWPQVVREAIASDKPKFIVMMVGVNDRQSIRERVPEKPSTTPARPGARPATPAASPQAPNAADPELQARESAEQQNAEQRSNEQRTNEQPDAAPAEPAPPATTVAGNFEFHTEKWEAAYIKRIDATIAALKSANVPVLWVGLPSQRSGRATSDSAYLNELYRGRAEKAGVTYVDVWDGFVDDAGRFVVQGPDFEGQIRKLRAGDGVYFTKAGARKLAHYVEREIQRNISNRAVPVALPAPEPVAPVATPAPGGARPTGPAARPLAGPVVPLTVSTGGGDELLGGGPVRGAQPRPVAVDPVANRVLTKGESVAAPMGRADDFGWPRGGLRSTVEPAVEIPLTPVPEDSPVAKPSRPPVVAAAPAAPEVAEPVPEKPKRKPAPRPVVRRDVKPEPFNPFGPGGGLFR